MVGLFRSHQVPLTLAVVPAWLTKPRAQQLLEICGEDSDSWGWIQHGWRHWNHEVHGKKQEFGPCRPLWRKKEDLGNGLRRLRTLLGARMLPVFTPPWNRCDQETLLSLPSLGYRAVSRIVHASPSTPSNLTDYPVTVDLHTRKEKDAESGWRSLLDEVAEGLIRGYCGFMLHHQRMNDAAFEFLEVLLQAFSHHKDLCLVHLKDLVRLNKAGILTQPFRQ